MNRPLPVSSNRISDQHAFVRPLLICFLLIITGSLNAQYAVSAISTDYQGLWQTSAASPNPVRPDNSHRLLAFTWNGTNFSTGVNDAALPVGSFTPRNFRAFPIDAISTAGSPLIALGQLVDGADNNPSTPAPFNTPAGSATLAGFLTDGSKGLDLGTGVANIAAGNLRFNLSALGISASAINDNVPDVIVSQIATPGGDLDEVYFVDAGGATVGSRLSINHTGTPAVGAWSVDFYNLNGSINIRKSDRDIRLWAADLTSFGITAANVGNAVALIYRLNGTSDPAFVAFNVPSISVASQLTMLTQPSATAASNCCSNINSAVMPQAPVVQVQDGSGNNILQSGIPVTVSIQSGPAGYGALGGTTTVLTDAGGQAVFSNLILPCTTGDYTLTFTSSNLDPATSGTATVTRQAFYPRAGSELTLSATTSWSSASDGSGAAPAGFGSGQEFVLSNDAGATDFATGGNWTVNGQLTVPATSLLNITASTTTTLTCDISNAGTIQAATGAVVILNGTSTQTLGGMTKLHSLTINNPSGVNFSGTGIVAGALALTNGSLTLNSGSLRINGTLTRTSGNINAAAGSSFIRFEGNTAINIPAATFTGSVANLAVNNTAGITINAALNVTGVLTLNNGTLTIGNNNLVTGSITGGSAAGYIRTNGTGRVSMNVAGSGGQRLFPVGRSSYNPVTITNNNTAADAFAVQVLDEVYQNGASGSPMTDNRIRRSWNIQKTGANTGAGFGMLFGWNAPENSGVTSPQLFDYTTRWTRQTTGTVTNPTSTSYGYAGYTGSSNYFAIFDNSVTLPVVWKSFEVVRKASQVALTWTTSSENLNKGFMVERSNNGFDWIRIGSRESAGNSQSETSYQFTDEQPITGANAYRIRQVDIDGRSTYSAVRTILMTEEGTASVVVLGNPVTNGTLRLNMKKTGDLYLIDAGGKTVLTRKAATGPVELNVRSLASGTYRLRLGDGGSGGSLITILVRNP